MIFDKNKAVGFFMGLEEGGLSFGAEITLNYDVGFQSRPMIGVYVIVELERPDEAVLGRITAVSSHGRLASSAGEDMGARAVEQRRDLPEDIKKQFLRYRCSVRLLGLLRENSKNVLFTPSHRRLPHMGAKVAFPDEFVLQSVAGAKRPGEPIGFLAMGEFIYAQGHPYAANFPPNFQILGPSVEPKFDANSMVSRRTAVLAKSGFGKSNLLKILFSRLYQNGSPTLSDRNGRQVPVGTLIFDPDGDYFWPGSGSDSPPGLCDVPTLVDQILLATDRPGPANYYESFRVSSSKIDLRALPPRQVISCAVPSERQGQRGTEALYRLRQNDWNHLVDAAWLDLHGSYGALSIQLITSICRLRGTAVDATGNGIRSTLLDIVAKLHNPSSCLTQVVKQGLADGKLIIVDLSLMRGQPATIITALLLRHIFEYNVDEHTKTNGQPFPVIALIEEAQKVLEGNDITHGPFIDWVKEGRKYGLGAALVTQQPGAIDQEILSQADNYFVFHLVSGGDLNALKQANGHFSDDILATLLNEPIEGQGVFWSSAGHEKSTYPIPFRAYNFGDLHHRLSDAETSNTPDNYASRIKSNLTCGKSPTPENIPQPSPTTGLTFPNKTEIDKKVRDAATKMQTDKPVPLSQSEFAFFLVEKWLKDSGTRQRGTRQYAVNILTVIFGLYGYGWELVNKTSQKGGNYIAVKILNKEEGLAKLESGEDPLVPDDNDSDTFDVDDEDLD